MSIWLRFTNGWRSDQLSAQNLTGHFKVHTGGHYTKWRWSLFLNVDIKIWRIKKAWVVNAQPNSKPFAGRNNSYLYVVYVVIFFICEETLYLTTLIIISVAPSISGPVPSHLQQSSHLSVFLHANLACYQQTWEEVGEEIGNGDAPISNNNCAQGIFALQFTMNMNKILFLPAALSNWSFLVKRRENCVVYATKSVEAACILVSSVNSYV